MAEEICSGNRVGAAVTSEGLRIRIGEILGMNIEIDILFEVDLAVLIRNPVLAQPCVCPLRGELLASGNS